MTENIRERVKEANEPGNKEKLLPAILVFVGSATGIVAIDGEGRGKNISAFLVGGKYFLGMAKAIIGTNVSCENYFYVISINDKVV